MPGKVIAAVMHKMASEAKHAGWHLACKIFFQAVLHIIHGHQGDTITDIIKSATLCQDRMHEFFEQDRHFHALCVMDLHPTMSEKVSSTVKSIKLKPPKAMTDHGVPKLPTAPTAPVGSKRPLQAQNISDIERGKTGGRRKSGGARGNDESQLGDATGRGPPIWNVDKKIQQCSCCGSGGVSLTKFIQCVCCTHACCMRHMCC